MSGIGSPATSSSAISWHNTRVKPYYIGHPVATALFYATVVILVANELLQSIGRRAEATNMDRGSRLVIGVSWVGAILLALLARSRATFAAYEVTAAIFYLALAIVWAGIALRRWSFATLGHYFTFDVMTSSDQPVITAGPYRFVRHPSYAALLLVFAGFGVMQGNALSLAILAFVPLLGLMYRIRVEEAALAETLGESYKLYAQSHKRLIPLVW